MSEVTVSHEGSLRWVRASGSGTNWATASAPASGLLGFVNSFTFTSARNYTVVSDRGTPSHNKHIGDAPVDVTVEFMFTGDVPTAVSGDGATVPMIHLEYRASAEHLGTGSGHYYQFHGVPYPSEVQFTENDEGSTIRWTLRALAANGPTASGYIA